MSRRDDKRRVDAIHSAADLVKGAILAKFPKCMIAELWEGPTQTESLVFRHSGEVIVLNLHIQEPPK